MEKTKTIPKHKQNGDVKELTLKEKIEDSNRRLKELEALYHQEVGKLKAYEEMK